MAWDDGGRFEAFWDNNLVQGCIKDVCEDSSRYVVWTSSLTGVDVGQDLPHTGWCEMKVLLLRSWCGFLGRCDVCGLEQCIEVRGRCHRPVWGL